MSKHRLVPFGLAAFVAVVLMAVGFAASGAAAPQATFKAGLVSDVGRFNDKGFNQNQLAGLKRAAKALKIQYRAVESRSAGDYLPNMASLARSGYNIVISAGFLLAPATEDVADQFPNTKFAITDMSVAGFNAQALERRGPDVRDAAEQLPDRLPRGTRRGREGQEEHQRRRRPQDPAGRHVPRRVQGRRAEVRPGDDGPDRLLAGLHRPGQVQERGSEPDRRGLAGRVRRCRSVRSRCARRGEGSRQVGGRRRRRPVVPRPPHPHQCGEESRPRGSSWPSRARRAARATRVEATSSST